MRGISVLLVMAVAFNAAVAQDVTENAVYQGWLETTNYEKSSTFSNPSASATVALHWTLEDDSIQLAVAAPAGGGWVGFGIAESGSMLGADVVMFATEEEGTNSTLTDAYVLDERITPLTDDCQSWELLDSISNTEDNLILFEAKRKLITNDSQDRNILLDNLLVPTRVIFAWGADTPTPTFHGLENVARSSVRFFGDLNAQEEQAAFERQMEQEAEGTFVVQADDFVVPITDGRTRYENFCVSRQDLVDMGVPMDQDLHNIGFEPIVDPRSSPYIHHFIVSATTQPWDSSLDCNEQHPAFEVVFSWAPGVPSLALPSNLGGPLGGTIGFQSFKVEIHYDNPDLKEDIVDSSGVRFYYTSQKRPIDLGIFQTGDPFVELEGELVSEPGGLAQHVFDCGGGCTESFQSTGEPVTVIMEQLHMHATGTNMINAQIRDGEEIRRTEIDFWDFDANGAFTPVQPEYEIQPGDAFRTTCNFDAKNNETWGLASDEEMCISFMYYYPRKVIGEAGQEFPYLCGIGFSEFGLPQCETGYSITPDFTQVAQLQRTFGTAPSTCDGDDDSSVNTAQDTDAPQAAPSEATPAPTMDESAAAETMVHIVSTFSLLALLVAWQNLL